jgi:hypothetical protein
MCAAKISMCCVFIFSTVYLCVLYLGQILSFGIRASCDRGWSLHHHQAASRAMEEGMLPGKSCHRRQGGDRQGAEAIAMKCSSSMSGSSTRCVIVDNMEVGHRRAASPVANMEASHRRAATPAANLWLRACHGGALVVKA